MNIYTFSDPIFGTNTYIVSEERQCFLIDPLLSVVDNDFHERYNITFAIVTHEHYDHICGIKEIRKRYDVKVLCGNKAEKGLADPAINLSRYVEYFNTVIPFGNRTARSCEYKCCSDGVVIDQQVVSWGRHDLFIKETPGHSVGSISVLLDNRYLFSGDSLFRDFPTATRLPGGSTKEYNNITVPWLDSLDQSILVYPGHGLPFTLGERFKD